MDTAELKPKSVKPRARKAKPANVSPEQTSEVISATPITVTTASSPEPAPSPTTPTPDPIPELPPKMTMDDISNDIYRKAAQRIVALMDAGKSLWQKPWTAPSGQSRPHNHITGLPYAGINRFNLMCEMLDHGWADSRFMSYRQVQTLAAGMAKAGIPKESLPHVMEGARGLTIYKLGFVEKKTPVLDAAGRPQLDGDGKPQMNIVRGKSFLKTYTIFHSSSVANCPPTAEAQAAPKWQVHSQIEDLVERLGVPVRYQAGDRAYYTVARDEGGAESITMPERSQWKNASDYYAVLLHEASHATGSTYPKRLCRPMLGMDGVESRAREELVAETSSYYLLSELGLGQTQNTDTTDGHALAALSNTTARTAAYLSSWREMILADPKALFHAFGQAEKAADWVMQRHAIQLEAAAKLATDGQALGQDVRHAVDEVVSQHMTFQTKENTESQQHNPWATLPVVERPSIHGGFGMA
jgi:antirestriction protein ArdC